MPSPPTSRLVALYQLPCTSLDSPWTIRVEPGMSVRPAATPLSPLPYEAGCVTVDKVAVAPAGITASHWLDGWPLLQSSPLPHWPPPTYVVVPVVPVSGQ